MAPTVHLAFDDTYYLEKACQFQMMAMMAVGGDISKLKMIDDEIVKDCAKRYGTQGYLEMYSVKHFYSWWNKFTREQPEVFQ